MCASEVNLLSQLDDLIQSLKNLEIRNLVSTCTRKSFSFTQISIYLKLGFDKEPESQIDTITSKMQDESQLTIDTQRLKEILIDLDSSLTKAIEANRETLGHKKQQMKASLGSYCKFAGLLGRPIDEQVQKLKSTIDGMSVTYPDADPNIAMFNEAISEAKKKCSSLKEQLQSIETTLKNYVDIPLPQDFIEKITKTEGIKLESIDLKTLQDLYGTKIRKVLRLSLSE